MELSKVFNMGNGDKSVTGAMRFQRVIQLIPHWPLEPLHVVDKMGVGGDMANR